MHPEHKIITPGAYLRMRREAAGVSLDDLALMLETAPPVSARSRAETLADVEADLVPVSEDLVRVLLHLQPFPFDAVVLIRLVDRHAGLATGGEYPQLCTLCACSEFDACTHEDGLGCAWVTPSLCSACASTDEGQRAAMRHLTRDLARPAA